MGMWSCKHAWAHPYCQVRLCWSSACCPGKLCWSFACSPVRLQWSSVCCTARLSWFSACCPVRLCWSSACSSARLCLSFACYPARDCLTIAFHDPIASHDIYAIALPSGALGDLGQVISAFERPQCEVRVKNPVLETKQAMQLWQDTVLLCQDSCAVKWLWC